MLLKLTPLTRLTSAFEADLENANDEKLESQLATQYLKRLAESQAKRDRTFKSLFTIDVILSIVIRGKDFVIPGTSISTGDLPALMEILLGLSSVAAYMASYTFCAWLCYSQIHYVFIRRKALKKKIDPDLIAFSEILSEPNLKMFSSKLNIWGEDWAVPQRPFSVIAQAYASANILFFLVIPAAQYALTYIALKQIIISSGFNIVHISFYSWVVLSNILTLFMLFVPHKLFSFAVKTGA